MINRTLFELLLFFAGAISVALFMPAFIRLLKQRALGQAIREEGLESHQVKAGTPTAGGLVFLGVFMIGVLLIACLGSGSWGTSAWWVVGVTAVMGLVGYIDDALKMSQQKNDGISGYVKLAAQIGLGVGIGTYLILSNQNPLGVTSVFGLWDIPLGWLFPLFCAVVMMATSNAVNITDGADGLAASTTIICLLGFYSVLVGGGMLGAPHLVAASGGNLYAFALLCLLMMGALFGFLLFNKKPAQVFMGDTGSLALGGFVAAVALMSGLEWFILLFGLLFVVEALSVVLQVASFKTTGKRIFKMSPIHHHFELCHWSEQKIVWAFSLFQLTGVVLGIWLYLYGLGHGSGTMGVY